jgi:uncharacterized protein involved in response to NO
VSHSVNSWVLGVPREDNTARVAQPSRRAVGDWHVDELIFGQQLAQSYGFPGHALLRNGLPRAGMPRLLWGFVKAWCRARLTVARDLAIGWLGRSEADISHQVIANIWQ